MDKHIEMKSAKSKPRSQTWYMLAVSFCLFIFNSKKNYFAEISITLLWASLEINSSSNNFSGKLKNLQINSGN